MTSVIHRVASLAAGMCLASFWLSTLLAETGLASLGVAQVKGWIVQGLWVLVPAMAGTGISGAMLARTRRGRLLAVKQRRMKAIAINGVAVMIPSALYLNAKAAAGLFDGGFYLVQTVELAVGAAQLALIGLNIRDGLRLSGANARSAAHV